MGPCKFHPCKNIVLWTLVSFLEVLFFLSLGILGDLTFDSVGEDFFCESLFSFFLGLHISLSLEDFDLTELTLEPELFFLTFSTLFVFINSDCGTTGNSSIPTSIISSATLESGSSTCLSSMCWILIGGCDRMQWSRAGSGWWEMFVLDCE